MSLNWRAWSSEKKTEESLVYNILQYFSEWLNLTRNLEKFKKSFFLED